MVSAMHRSRRQLLASHDLAFRLTRTSPTPPDRDTVVQRANPFASAVNDVARRGERITLLTARTERETLSYIITPGQGSNSHVVTSLATALGAKATQVDSMSDISEVLDTPFSSFLVARPSKNASFATQSGGDQNEVAVLLGRLLQPGSWVAFTLRKPSESERNRTRKWFEHRRDANSVAHYTNHLNSLVASVFAGGSSLEEVDTLLTQVVSAIPGFDIETKPFSPAAIIPTWAAPLVGIAAGGVAGYELHRTIYGVAVGAAAAVLTFIIGKVPATGTRTDRDLQNERVRGVLPAPAHRRIPPRRPVRRTVQRDDGTPRNINRPGDYPLASSSFLVGPAMAIGIVSPHSGSSSTIADIEYRRVPRELLDDVGPIVAYADSPSPDEPTVAVHLDALEMYGGVGALGLPGTGKTTLLQNLWAWHVLERVRPSGRPGYPGADDTLIAFESKGEGTVVYDQWSRVYGDTVVIVEVADPSTPALHMVDPSLPPNERARLFVAAMKYAWDESAIQALSTETLVAVFTAAMTIMDYAPAVAKATEAVTNGEVSFMSIAHLLLGGNGSYDDAKQVAANLAAVFQDCPDDDLLKSVLGVSVSSLNVLFGPDATQTKWSNAVSSSRNKVDQLMGVPHWWAPSRPHGSWKDALKNHYAVVVNSGVSRSGFLLDEDTGSVIASMTAYALKVAMMQNCAGWESKGKYVSIFADEIAVLAKSSSEVIQWLREQGRAYGVRPFIAAQWPDQLPPKVRNAFMSFSSLFWFQQSDHAVIDDAVMRLSVNGGQWASADIANLAKYQAIMHAFADGQLRLPCAVRMGYWPDAAKFAQVQGYASLR
jgi:hypothetical protein